MSAERTRRGGRARALVLPGLLALTSVWACDFQVTNPGPVQDAFLDDPEAHQALVNGMGRAVAEALNWIGYTGAAVTREIHPSGSTGSFGITVRWQRGELPYDEVNTHWNLAQRARWLAEHGIERMERVGPASQELLAQAYLWAGYANRLLGENMCEAVIDGGAPMPYTEYLNRAEGQFTKAAEIGSGDLRTAAIAGRASVRVDLGDWAGAVADAAQVPTDFEYKIPYFDLGDNPQYNRIAFATAAEPYKAHTVWNTVYEQYYLDTNDPRTPWLMTNEVGDAAIDCCGKVPWWPQQKYRKDSPIRLSSGREMRLIEAEAKLVQGDWQGAMAIINAIRADVGVPPWPASSLNEAWTRLKRERGIELWLEGRRLGDFRRWKANNTPGELDPLEVPGPASHLERQDLCFPIARSEVDTNPNVPKPSG